MRILQISSASSFAGGERYLVDLANLLSARGHEVYAALRPNSPIATPLNIPVDRLKLLPMRNALDAPSAQALSSFIQQHRIDVIHAHMARDYSLAAYAARRNRSAKFFVTRHVLFPLNRFHRRTLAYASGVIAVSNAVGKELQKQGVVPNDLINVIPNGIDLKRFERARASFNRDAFLRSMGLQDQKLLVGSIGELRRLKRHDDFIRAAAIISQRVKNVHFVIAGVDTSESGEVREQLHRLVTELNIESQVQFLGWLDNAVELLLALDVFVSASETESFGLAIGEAMAAGTAVVATATEGARELIENGTSGYLVPVGFPQELATATLQLLAEEKTRRTLGENARARIEQSFSLERMVDQIEQLYELSHRS